VTAHFFITACAAEALLARADGPMSGGDTAATLV